MKIDIVCSDPDHPVNALLARWQKSHGDNYMISICQRVADPDRDPEYSKLHNQTTQLNFEK